MSLAGTSSGWLGESTCFVMAGLALIPLAEVRLCFFSCWVRSIRLMSFLVDYPMYTLFDLAHFDDLYHCGSIARSLFHEIIASSCIIITTTATAYNQQLN